MRATNAVATGTCGCEGHECLSSLLVEPDVGGRRVDWRKFLEEYNPEAFHVEFVKMHSDHFTAKFSDAATGRALRICVLRAQKAQIEGWMQHAPPEGAF
jgi:hypothetical protein